jgi:hypothetical protein
MMITLAALLFCIFYIDPGEVLALPANTFNASLYEAYKFINK